MGRIRRKDGAKTMNNAPFRVALFVATVAALVLNSAAEQPKLPAPGPVPVQIAAAHKIFLSNAAEMNFEGIFDDTELNGSPDRFYDEVYAQMKDWGRYELVSSPADADLVVELRWRFNEIGFLKRDSFLGQPDMLGQLRVTIIDPKTHIPLWNLAQNVHGAVQLGNREKNFDQAVYLVVNRFKVLANPPASSEAAHK